MAKQAPDTDKGRDTVRDQTRFKTQSCISLVVIYVHIQIPPPPQKNPSFSNFLWIPRLTAHVQNNIVSYSKQQYLM